MEARALRAIDNHQDSKFMLLVNTNLIKVRLMSYDIILMKSI